MNVQSNYVCIDDDISEDELDNLRFIKQKTENWFNIRKDAHVTGSTANTSLGLDTLKKQTAHYDKVYHGIENPIPEKVKQYMQYGSDSEIHATATLVSKVLPVFFPDIYYCEEGCYVISNDQLKIVVSPDGSGRRQINESAVLGFEFKCPAPEKKFSTQIMYQVPKYYIPQILSEMHVLQCDELIFLCWSEQSSTVFQIKNDTDLWKEMEINLTEVYGTQHHKRPSRISTKVKEFKLKISEFIKTKTKLIAEVKSVKAISCFHSANDKPIFHTLHQHGDTLITVFDGINVGTDALESIQETLHLAEKSVMEAHELCRKLGSEIFAFLISDLDRIKNDDSQHYYYPIAYGLKGYSLSCDTVRKIVVHLLKCCYDRQISIPVSAFDGQWAKLVVRGDDGQPLTRLQLQKDIFKKAQAASKSEIIKHFVENGIVAFTDIEDPDKIIEINKNPETELILKRMEQHFDKKIPDNSENRECTSSNRQIDDHILETIPQCHDKILDFMNDIENVNKEITLNSLNAEEISVDSITEENVGETFCMETPSDNSDVLKEHDSIRLNSTDIHIMLVALKSSVEKFKNEPEESLEKKFSSAKAIEKEFTKHALVVCFNAIKGKLVHLGIKCKSTMCKSDLVNVFSKVIGDGTVTTKVYHRKRTNNTSLFEHWSKHALSCLYATCIYSNEERKWKEKSPFLETDISEVGKLSWFSQPSYISEINQYHLFFLDGPHLLSNCRVKCCTTGMPKAGIDKNAWRDVARLHSKDTGLSVAMVEDLIDKQSTSIALLTFSEPVENAMIGMNYFKTAYFCRLVRNWYCAIDEPGILQKTRIQMLLEFRTFLLDEISFKSFPPPGAYVKDFPIIMYEGFLTSIERRLQLFSFTTDGSYNTRTVSSMDIENFFGTFHDLDPKGTGVLNPDDIPSAIATACELSKLNFDDEKTCQKRVYPQAAMPLTPTTEVMDIQYKHSIMPNVYQSSKDPNHPEYIPNIVVKDHIFDESNQRQERNPKRKRSNITMPGLPSRGVQPIRQFHKCDESKILPHKRLGIQLQ